MLTYTNTLTSQRPFKYCSSLLSNELHLSIKSIIHIPNLPLNLEFFLCPHWTWISFNPLKLPIFTYLKVRFGECFPIYCLFRNLTLFGLSISNPSLLVSLKYFNLSYDPAFCSWKSRNISWDSQSPRNLLVLIKKATNKLTRPQLNLLRFDQANSKHHFQDTSLDAWIVTFDLFSTQSILGFLFEFPKSMMHALPWQPLPIKVSCDWVVTPGPDSLSNLLYSWGGCYIQTLSALLLLSSCWDPQRCEEVCFPPLKQRNHIIVRNDPDLYSRHRRLI